MKINAFLKILMNIASLVSQENVQKFMVQNSHSNVEAMEDVKEIRMNVPVQECVHSDILNVLTKHV